MLNTQRFEHSPAPIGPEANQNPPASVIDEAVKTEPFLRIPDLKSESESPTESEQWPTRRQHEMLQPMEPVNVKPYDWQLAAAGLDEDGEIDPLTQRRERPPVTVKSPGWVSSAEAAQNEGASSQPRSQIRPIEDRIQILDAADVEPSPQSLRGAPLSQELGNISKRLDGAA